MGQKTEIGSMLTWVISFLKISSSQFSKLLRQEKLLPGESESKAMARQFPNSYAEVVLVSEKPNTMISFSENHIKSLIIHSGMNFDKIRG